MRVRYHTDERGVRSVVVDRRYIENDLRHFTAFVPLPVVIPSFGDTAHCLFVSSQLERMNRGQSWEYAQAKAAEIRARGESDLYIESPEVYDYMSLGWHTCPLFVILPYMDSDMIEYFINVPLGDSFLTFTVDISAYPVARLR